MLLMTKSTHSLSFWVIFASERRITVPSNSTKLERKFQADLIKELKSIFPGCVIQKQDADAIQGIPDLLILYNDRWAMLECKRSASARHRPNQDYYVGKFDSMSFCRFIYPENKTEVLDALQQSLCSDR